MHPHFARHSATAKMRALCIAFLSLMAFSCAVQRSSVHSVTTDQGIEILEDDSSVLFYQVKPKSLNGKFERASYVHPLYSLRGSIITEDFPDDHPHHHGVYFAWHQIVLNGKRIADGWTNDNITFEVADARLRKKGDHVAINSEVLWKSVLNGQHAEVVAKENLEITVYPSNKQFRVIDFEMTLVPMMKGLAIGGSDDEKGYGGFSLRLKLPEDIRFMATGQEVQPKVVSVEAGPWMNFTGSFDGEASPRSGVLVFCHPSNPGSPQPWILRKQKSMQNVAFPGRHPVVISPGGLTLRYRVILSRNVLPEDLTGALFREYARTRRR